MDDCREKPRLSLLGPTVDEPWRETFGGVALPRDSGRDLGRDWICLATWVALFLSIRQLQWGLRALFGLEAKEIFLFVPESLISGAMAAA